jgi:hypothetical protein
VTNTESGTLADQPLGSLLRDLAGRQFSGIVHIEGSSQRIICFESGRLYLATSSSGPSLQRVFVELGAVDAAGWKRAIDMAPERGSVVDSLLAEGVAKEMAADALRELNVGTLLELLVPDKERFTVAPEESHQLGAAISFDVEDLLTDAADRLQRWGSLRDGLPSMDTVLFRARVLPAGLTSIQLNRVQWRILDELAVPSTLEALIERTGLGAFGIFDELYGLLTEGAVVTDDEPPSPS